VRRTRRIIAAEHRKRRRPDDNPAPQFRLPLESRGSFRLHWAQIRFLPLLTVLVLLRLLSSGFLTFCQCRETGS